MKARTDHTSPTDPDVDLHAPIYSGELGYVTEAERLELMASIDQGEREYEKGEWVDAETVVANIQALSQQLRAK